LKRSSHRGHGEHRGKLARDRVLPEKEKTCRTKVRRSQKTGFALRARRTQRKDSWERLGTPTFKLACLEKKLTQRARRTQRKTGKGQGSPRKRKDLPD